MGLRGGDGQCEEEPSQHLVWRHHPGRLQGVWCSCTQAPALNPGIMGSFWTPPFSKVFLNFPTPLGLSLLLPQLSDQPNVNKKTCRANFQSSEQLAVITAPGKNEKIPSSIISTIFKGIFQVGVHHLSIFQHIFPGNLVLMFNLLKG